jgi:tRNA-(ms[2]io[6]A)-hydroxylase
MLGLKMATDPRWVNIVEKNIDEILTDHAYCEQKASSNAISIIVKFPHHSHLVTEMTAIALEEMEHFGMVHEEILKRGLTLGKERKDPYVNDLLAFAKQGGNEEERLVDRLLVAAMIEARSCERFRLLSEEISDKDLRVFYRDLMESEARHYTTFLKLAKKYGGKIDVDKRWVEFLAYETSIITKYGTKETMHG